MLEKAFQRVFFEKVTALTDQALEAKIEEVQKTSKQFDRGTEAASDSRFMLRHMRRIRTERLFTQMETLKH